MLMFYGNKTHYVQKASASLEKVCEVIDDLAPLVWLVGYPQGIVFPAQESIQDGLYGLDYRFGSAANVMSPSPIFTTKFHACKRPKITR